MGDTAPPDPSRPAEAEAPGGPALVDVRDVRREFAVSGTLLDELRIRRGRIVRERETVKAVNGVSMGIRRGEALCVVGESGCGKTTLGRMVMGLLKPTAGEVHYGARRIDNLPDRELKGFRRRMQMIFQNPYASLNPRKTVRFTLEEPVRHHFPGMSRAERIGRVDRVMESVGISPGWGGRRPHEFSGGQRQRISIARALMVDPEFIVADEPISALDVSIQAQVLNLMMEAREARGLTYLFITHDLSVVEHFGDRVAVMYLGAVCELGPTRGIFGTPRHPYTRALLGAIPRLGTSRHRHIRLEGEVPTPINLPAGCHFHGRCPHVSERCRREAPALLPAGDGRLVACHGVAEGWI